MTDLSTYYMGLPVPSPIIAASSTLTSSPVCIAELARNGAGAVVLNSLFEEEIVVELNRRKESLNALNINHPEVLEFYEKLDVDEILNDYLKLIFEAKKSVDIPIIASINCVSPGKWHYFAKYLQEAGADGLELNIFTLPADMETSGQVYEEAALEIIRNTMAELNIPVCVKISPYYSGLGNMISQIDSLGVKGITLFNRFFKPDLNLDEMTVGAGPVYTDPSEYLNTLRWVGLVAGKVECDIYASGGIHDGLTAAKMLAAGAQGVQVASAMYRNGLSCLPEIIKGLSNWMESKGFEGINDFRGMLSHNKINNPAAYMRVQFLKTFAGKAEK